MSETLEQIRSELKEAQKAQDSFKVGTLRYILSAIHNAEIEKGKGETLTEEELVTILQKQAKQRRESIEAYEKGGRADLAEKEQKELGIIESYLPEQMGEEEITKLVEEAISVTGASSPQDMAKVMGVLMPKIKGKADGSLVSRLVKENLSV